MSKPSLVLICYVFYKTCKNIKIIKDETKIKQELEHFLHTTYGLPCISHGVSPHPQTTALEP